MGKKISNYLTLNEYKCRCCDGLPPSLDLNDIPAPYQMLFDSFDFIREAWGKPIWVSSGYRCKMNNAMVGGSVLSAHMFGLALDLSCDDVDEVYNLEDVVEEVCPDLRRGRYVDSGHFLHIDVAYYIYPKATDKWRECVRWTG